MVCLSESRRGLNFRDLICARRYLTYQEIIKVRVWIPYIGPLTKVIPLKLFLDIVPNSSADIARALRGCFREGFVYMHVISFRFKAKENVSFDIVVISKGASAFSMFKYILKLE